MPMITVSHLTKRYGRVTAVDDVSFEVGAHEIVGILGPNGAGKTTTLQVLACYLAPGGGEVAVDGLDVIADSLAVRERIGYLPEQIALYGELRADEYLRYRGSLKGLRGRRLRDRMGRVCELCGLTEVRREVIGRLSRGFRQRIGLADAILHDPPLLILDEPTIGLDPNQIRQMRNLIRSLGEHHTVLLASHILPEVEMICRRVLIMNRGRIVASDAPGNLVGLLRGRARVVAEIGGADRAAVESKVKQMAGVTSLSCDSSGAWHRLTCECEQEADLREALFRLVSENGWTLRELKAERQNLEDVFVAVTGEEL